MTRKLHADFLLIADQINLALKQAISIVDLCCLRPQRYSWSLFCAERLPANSSFMQPAQSAAVFLQTVATRNW